MKKTKQVKVDRPLVEVEWEDSAFNTGWRTSTSQAQTSICRTTGYFIKKTKGRVIIAMNVNSDGGFGEAMVIPRSVVHAIRELGSNEAR